MSVCHVFLFSPSSSPVKYLQAVCLSHGAAGTNYDCPHYATSCNRRLLRPSSEDYIYIGTSYRVTQFYRIKNLHPPGNPVTAVVLRTAIKETHCSIRTQGFSEIWGNVSIACSVGQKKNKASYKLCSRMLGLSLWPPYSLTCLNIKTIHISDISTNGLKVIG
jgi:hypothetical protein